MIDYRQWEEWLLCWSGEARPAMKYGWVKIYLTQACVQTFACLMPWFSTLLSRHFEIVRFRFTVFYPQVFCLKQHLFPSRRGTTHIFHSSHNRYLSFTRADQPLGEGRLMKKRLGLDRNNEKKDSAVNEVINDGQCGSRGWNCRGGGVWSECMYAGRKRNEREMTRRMTKVEGGEILSWFDM